MEEPENNLINNNQKETNQISFSEYFYNNIDLLPILKESLEKMKKFIIFIINQMKKVGENKEEKQSKFLSEKILDFMIKNYEKLGIPFFYQLINEEEFINIFMNLIFDNIHVEQIKTLFDKIIDIFNFDYKQRQANHPLNLFYIDCINFGVITQKDVEKNELRESLTEEEILFLYVVSTKNKWKDIQDNHMENDAEVFLDKLLQDCEEQLVKVIEEDLISTSSIQFYKEMINEIKNYKNSIKPKKEAKKQKKEINYDVDFYYQSEEEYEDEEIDEKDKIMSQEEIKEDIKKLRKLPLKDRTYFYKDELIKDDENEYIEFKNYFFPLHDEQERELKRQFCAFLNTHGGRIYIGINDEKMVKGVNTDYKLEHYENIILGLTKNFCPIIDPKNYFKFYAIPIKDNKNGKIKDNFFVFKIIIRKGDPTELYYDFNNYGLNVATRQAGQCPNLKASEIYEKILERKKIKNLQNNKIDIDNKDFDMNDPLPLYNKTIIENEENKGNWRRPKFQKKKISTNHHKSNNYKINNRNIIINNNINNNNNNINNKNLNNNINNNINSDQIMFEKKNNKKKKKKKKNTNKQIRVEISNIDRNVDENTMIELFKDFNYTDYKFYRNQNQVKNGYLEFDNEEDAKNFMGTFNGATFGEKKIKLHIKQNP